MLLLRLWFLARHGVHFCVVGVFMWVEVGAYEFGMHISVAGVMSTACRHFSPTWASPVVA